MRRRRPLPRRLGAALVLLTGAALVALAFAQGRGPRHGEAFPTWPVSATQPEDLFTFVRLRYSSRSRWGGGWATDYPESDHNFSFRLQQVTSWKVNPRPLILDITDPALHDHPFAYLIEPGGMVRSDVEAEALRRWLLSGGFLMIDDFWGEREYANLARELGKVFPDREPQELDLSHPIFHTVFDLKEKPQMPSIHHWLSTGQTYEKGGREVHYRALFDDEGRMMVIICHNTDLGDGWEEEGEDPEYFRKFAEPMAYPMGINILFYAMTH
jgi:hypothetical protein